MKQYSAPGIAALLLLFALLCCTTFQSCTKPPDDNPAPGPKPTPCSNCLPPVTTEGKGTFGCKVNGKVWLPKGSWGSPATRIEYFNDNLMINGYRSSDETKVNINVKPIYDTGYYDFSTFNFESSRGLYRNVTLTINYRAQPITKGYVHLLRFDPYIKGIISGTFEFDAYNSEGDTVHITEGRFDLYF